MAPEMLQLPLADGSIEKVTGLPLAPPAVEDVGASDDRGARRGRGEGDALGTGVRIEGLLDLRGRLVAGVAGLVGVDDAGADSDEGDGGTRDAAAPIGRGSIEKVTGLPLAPPVAVGVGASDDRGAGRGRGEGDALGAKDGEGLLDLGRGFLPRVASLVGVDTQVPAATKVTVAPEMLQLPLAEGSIEKVTGLPFALPAAVGMWCPPRPRGWAGSR